MNTNYYQVLGCRSDASHDEIKRRYHDLALKFHPDKGDHSDNGNHSFHEINEAWKMLRDPVRRRAYDEYLRQRMLEEQNLIYGTFTLDELHYDASTATYSCLCRCGGYYSFTRQGSEGFNSCLVSCEHCSLMIYVDFELPMF